ncbi:MAG TPA: hypothetical protein VLY21_02755 [Nitrososphaerales archaeon]|nr:hypothetical protein [Nitrososphaerales archaeon]
MTARPRSRLPRSVLVRGAYSVMGIVVVVVVTMVGLHYLEGLSYLNAFYFTAMLATGEGPNTAPVTAAGKVFVGVMAFVSVGAVIGSLLFIFGPFFSQVAREGVEIIEEAEERRRKTPAERDRTGQG